MNKLSDVCSFAMNHYIFLSLTNKKSSVHLHALYSPRTALRTFTTRRDQFMICGQYVTILETCNPETFQISEALLILC
jgi:hypothetical protein